MINYTWQIGDLDWFVVNRFLAQSGYTNPSDMLNDMYLINQQVTNGAPAVIYDWAAIPPGTVVRIPLNPTGIN